MNILCLDLEPRDDLPLFQAPRWLPEGTPHRLVKASREEMPGSVAPYSHLILSGSSYSVLDDRPCVAPAMELIRQAVAMERPILGICYGHQLVVRTLLGGRHVRRAEVAEMGWFPVRALPAGHDLFAGLPNPFHTFLSHFDEVCDLPAAWEVIAETDLCAVHGYMNRQLRILGFQFHPEMDVETGNTCFTTTRDELERSGFDVDRIVATARDDGSGRVLIPRFLDCF